MKTGGQIGLGNIMVIEITQAQKDKCYSVLLFFSVAGMKRADPKCVEEERVHFSLQGTAPP